MQHDAITSAWAPFFNGVTVLSAVVKKASPNKKQPLSRLSLLRHCID
jgi:hypothetical protein